jgi:hypothetical protein
MLDIHTCWIIIHCKDSLRLNIIHSKILLQCNISHVQIYYFVIISYDGWVGVFDGGRYSRCINLLQSNNSHDRMTE